jgi:hypothetical protein
MEVLEAMLSVLQKPYSRKRKMKREVFFENRERPKEA